ncbi:class I SAM-dependent methyltransferase [Leptospira broomii]|nr:class I SAM-dependent methyltransferase [Leptospira broomii]
MSNTTSRPEDMALAIGAKKLHEGRQFMYDAAKRYHDSFKDPKTGFFKSEYLEKRSCPVCLKDNERVIFNADGGVYVKCNECGMGYLNPVFTDDSLTKFYTGNNTVQSEVVENESDFYKKIYMKGLEALTPHTKRGAILDVGCSAGGFLDIAKSNGWDTWGVELNEAEIAYTKKKGHKAFNQMLESIEFPIKFNAITLWDVFEHIKDGHKYLKLMKRLLAPDGVIFIQVPNFHALAARVLQEKCKMFDGLEHVNLYSPVTLKVIAEKNDFEIVSMSTVISEIPIVNNYLNYEDAYLGDIPHGGKVINLIDEKLLHENYLGYKIQAVLKNGG